VTSLILVHLQCSAALHFKVIPVPCVAQEQPPEAAFRQSHNRRLLYSLRIESPHDLNSSLLSLEFYDYIISIPRYPELPDGLPVSVLFALRRPKTSLEPPLMLPRSLRLHTVRKTSR
jgi:hypothetical protein